MNPSILEQGNSGTFNGSILFPEILAKLSAEGVESYSSNLIRGMTTYYGSDLSHLSIPWPKGHQHPVASEFSPSAVTAAIRASQAREILYPTFLYRIAVAGVASYSVYLKGRKAIYFSRHGECITEPFPS